MVLSLTIAVGYLTVPFVIKSSVRALSAEEEEEKELGIPQWAFGSTISVSCFVQSPPNIYPTLEKHVLQLTASSNKFERETLTLLSQAFQQAQSTTGKSAHGLIIIQKDLLGILSCTEQPSVFTLQIVQFDKLGQLQKPSQPQEQLEPKSYCAIDSNSVPNIDHCVKPIEMMRLCQLWPDSQPQLVKLAKQVYKLASLYAYWDYWRLFEGVCSRHQISAEQLVNTN